MPTHGSLTKAGRVRSITPKVDKTSMKRKTIPRKKNKERWLKMLAGKSHLSPNSRRRKRR